MDDERDEDETDRLISTPLLGEDFGLDLTLWQRSLLEWLLRHKDCGGKIVTYAGRNEYRWGCTCEGRYEPASNVYNGFCKHIVNPCATVKGCRNSICIYRERKPNG